jgi:Domain of unknown function (DUF4249)
MKKYSLFAALLAFLLIQIDCQYPVKNSELPDPQQFIVITANITETYGFLKADYTLSEVTSLGGYNFTAKPVISNAYITDGQGRRYDFQADGFLGNGFQGALGQTYKLNLEADGKQYESLVETMSACPEIDSVSQVYTEETFRAPLDVNYKGFDIYMYLQDRPNEENYYQFDWVHYERAYSCDKKFDPITKTFSLVPCVPYDCWNIGYNSKVIVEGDKLRDGTQISSKLVRVPFVTPPSKYYLRVEQRAISKTVFAYYQSLEVQTQNAGTLFDIPAQTKFSPNITCVSNPEDKVLGVFNVFSSRFRVFYVDRSQVINGSFARSVADPTPFTSEPLLQAPCVESLVRTQTKPIGWVD